MAVKQRLSVSLPQDAIVALKHLAQERGTTATSALEKAIATEDYIQQELKTGSRLLIQKPDGTITQVVFR